MTSTSRHSSFATVALGASAVFIALVALLHGVKPELEPSWRMVSEYSIGENGWLMRVAFLTLSVSFGSVLISVRPHIATLGGRVGLALLGVATLGTLMAALFAADPITAEPDEVTAEGSLHAVASLLGLPTLPIAALLISGSLKRNPMWADQIAGVRWAAHLTWLTLLAMVATLFATVPAAGGFGPEVPIGWQNRIVLAAYTFWVVVVAWQARRVELAAGARYATSR